MKVIPKQIELIAIKCDFSKEFYINIGKYIEDNRYRFVDDPRSFDKQIILIDNNGNEIKLKRECYILIDSENKGEFRIITEEEFRENFIEVL